MSAVIEVDVNIQESAWESLLPNAEVLARKVVRHVCELTGLSDYAKRIEVSFLLTDDDSIQELNHQYRDKDKPTNVLSFPQEKMEPGEYEEWEEEEVVLGDVICALQTMQKEAEEQGKTFQHHVMHLWVHGLLHLQGYDHGTEREAAVMEALEVEILQDFSIANPYDE
jgi:probable rRNA maturation factor